MNDKYLLGSHLRTVVEGQLLGRGKIRRGIYSIGGEEAPSLVIQIKRVELVN